MVGRGRLFNYWQVPAERMESEKELRATIYKKLSKENSMEQRGEEEEEGEALRLSNTFITSIIFPTPCTLVTGDR